mmetsp:Transcript_9757/g.20836  ORF Transcript_9757/g.20836 Transcript_9757/m.20836 type:complete len:228 (-) Transcript_9757:152-835(-)
MCHVALLGLLLSALVHPAPACAADHVGLQVVLVGAAPRGGGEVVLEEGGRQRLVAGMPVVLVGVGPGVQVHGHLLHQPHRHVGHEAVALVVAVLLVLCQDVGPVEATHIPHGVVPHHIPQRQHRQVVVLGNHVVHVLGALVEPAGVYVVLHHPLLPVTGLQEVHVHHGRLVRVVQQLASQTLLDDGVGVDQVVGTCLHGAGHAVIDGKLHEHQVHLAVHDLLCAVEG